MATKKEHKFVEATTNVTTEKPEMKQAKPVGNASGLRAGAVVLWVLALVCEVLGILILFGKITLTFMPTLYQFIGLMVIDLILVIVGSQLWKKANHIDPASEKNPTKFWLWNNMGVIVCCIAFVPFIILLLTNKNLDKKTKTLATVCAVICLLIGGVASVDFNPVSEEQKTAAVTELSGTTVYWSPYGKVYHTHDDCGYLNQTEELTYGTVEQAIAEGRTKLCSHCAKTDNIENVVTD